MLFSQPQQNGASPQGVEGVHRGEGPPHLLRWRLHQRPRAGQILRRGLAAEGGVEVSLRSRDVPLCYF